MSANIDWTQLVTKSMKEQAAAAQVLAGAIAETAARRIMADAAIAPLQDAIDIAEATEAETMQLTAWKKYRVLLNRVSAQAGYPKAIDWPIPPI